MNIPNSQQPIVPTTFRQTGNDDYRVATSRDQNSGDWLFSCDGLTKREYFAGLAMQGWIACQSPSFRGEKQDCAKKAIEYADELLKQLEK